MIEQLLQYQSVDAKLREIETEISQSEERKKAVSAQKFLNSVNDNIALLEKKAEELANKYNESVALYKRLGDEIKEYDGVDETDDPEQLGYVKRKAQELNDEIEKLANAWCPAIRSKTAIRSSVKRNLIDPSLAVAALGITPEYFNTDFKTLGFLFESLVIRDLKIYSSASNGQISYYRDRYGLEADCVLHLEDGRYALIEIKLGAKEIDDGAKHLLEIERLIKEKNETEKQCPIPLPTLKMVVTGTQYGYKREDGVLVVPIGCLKD